MFVKNYLRCRWGQRIAGSHRISTVSTNAAGKPKPKDHIDKERKRKEAATMPESSTKYEDIIEAEKALMQPTKKNGISASTRVTRNMARVEAAIAAGLGGLVGDQVLRQIVADEETSKAAYPSTSSGPESIESLSAKLADKGFDLDGDWGSATISKATTAQQKQASSSLSSIELLKPPPNAKFATERRENEDFPTSQRRNRQLMFPGSDSESDDEARLEAAATRLFSLPPPPQTPSTSFPSDPIKSREDKLKGVDSLLQEVLRVSKEEERAASLLKGPRGTTLPPRSTREMDTRIGDASSSDNESYLEAAQWDLLSSLPGQDSISKENPPAMKSSSHLESVMMKYAKKEEEEAREEAEMRAMMIKVRKEKTQPSILRPQPPSSFNSLPPNKKQKPLDRGNLDSLLDFLGPSHPVLKSRGPEFEDEDDLLSMAAGGWKEAKDRASKRDTLVRPKLQSDPDEAWLKSNRPQSQNSWIQDALSDDRNAQRRRRREEDIFIPPPPSTPKLKKPPPRS